MRRWSWTSLVAIATFAVFAAPAAADQRPIQDGVVLAQWQSDRGSDAYDRGYREGLRGGENDAREGRRFDYQRQDAYRDVDRFYGRDRSDRDAFRDSFRRGFAEGYREGFERVRVRVGGPYDNRRDGQFGRRYPGYQEQASSRGYSDGYSKGVDDGRDRDRYDPVGHKEYRKADQGYERNYGPKDAYQNNYRAGFRQGYEDGYRDGTRRRR